MIPTEILEKRRLQFAQALNGQRALIPSGMASPRNYPANPLPFRASSHFLHLVGRSFQGAWLCFGKEAEAQLFLPAEDPVDLIWHGPQQERAALSTELGLELRSLEQLPAALNGPVATIPAMDAASRKKQSQYLQRPIQLGHFDPMDLPLVEALVVSRIIQDKAALSALREAAQASARAQRLGMAATHPGMRAWEIRGVMEGYLMREGMSCSFPSIITTRGEILHNSGHEDLLQEGDLLLSDLGAETRGGYAGDVSRTWPVSGRFSSSQAEIYQLVLSAQAAALALIQPGVRFREIHLEACRALTAGLVHLEILQGSVDELMVDNLHALFMPHGIGHLLGLDVHDMEDLGDRAGYAPWIERSKTFGLRSLRLDRELEVGMTLTIEPGFYQIPSILKQPERFAQVKGRLNLDRLKDFQDVRGIRIEDDILVTDQGAEILSQGAPKSLSEVEAAVGID